MVNVVWNAVSFLFTSIVSRHCSHTIVRTGIKAPDRTHDNTHHIHHIHLFNTVTAIFTSDISATLNWCVGFRNISGAYIRHCSTLFSLSHQPSSHNKNNHKPQHLPPQISPSIHTRPASSPQTFFHTINTFTDTLFNMNNDPSPLRADRAAPAPIQPLPNLVGTSYTQPGNCKLNPVSNHLKASYQYLLHSECHVCRSSNYHRFKFPSTNQTGCHGFPPASAYPTSCHGSQPASANATSCICDRSSKFFS